MYSSRETPCIFVHPCPKAVASDYLHVTKTLKCFPARNITAEDAFYVENASQNFNKSALTYRNNFNCIFHEYFHPVIKHPALQR